MSRGGCTLDRSVSGIVVLVVCRALALAWIFVVISGSHDLAVAFFFYGVPLAIGVGFLRKWRGRRIGFWRGVVALGLLAPEALLTILFVPWSIAALMSNQVGGEVGMAIAGTFEFVTPTVSLST